jgi:hypothetical protein
MKNTTQAAHGVFNRTVKRGDRITLLVNKHTVWIKRTVEELRALQDADRDAGRFQDEGGEPILYSKYSGWPQDAHQVSLVVTSCRPRWHHWNRRPKGLRAGWCREAGPRGSLPFPVKVDSDLG